MAQYTLGGNVTVKSSSATIPTFNKSNTSIGKIHLEYPVFTRDNPNSEWDRGGTYTFEIPITENIKEELITSLMPELKKYKSIIPPKRVIYSDPVTVVIWGDDTVTSVKCGSDCVYSEYGGFCAATTKKVYGSNNAIRRAAGLPKEKRVKA